MITRNGFRNRRACLSTITVIATVIGMLAERTWFRTLWLLRASQIGFQLALIDPFVVASQTVDGRFVLESKRPVWNSIVLRIPFFTAVSLLEQFVSLSGSILVSQ